MFYKHVFRVLHVISLTFKIGQIKIIVRSFGSSKNTKLEDGSYCTILKLQNIESRIEDLDQNIQSEHNFFSPTIFFFQDDYIQSRAETMQNIESTIVELGQIFTQLAHMVKEQEEAVQR